MLQNPRNTEDDTPWAAVASLGLFKLFNDWQAQGYNVPKELSKPPDAAPEVSVIFIEYIFFVTNLILK